MQTPKFYRREYEVFVFGFLAVRRFMLRFQDRLSGLACIKKTLVYFIQQTP
jgi:hypothetical protein